MIQSLLDVAKKNVGRSLTVEEQDELVSKIEIILNNPNMPVRELDNDFNEELQSIIREKQIISIGHAIRKLISAFVEIRYNIHPSTLNSKFSEVYTYHGIISTLSADLLQLAIEYAENDMFYSEFKVEKNISEYIDLFNRYTSDVLSFNINAEITDNLIAGLCDYRAYWEAQISALKRKNAIINRRKYLIDQINELLSVIAEYQSTYCNKILLEYRNFNKQELDKLCDF